MEEIVRVRSHRRQQALFALLFCVALTAVEANAESAPRTVALVVPERPAAPVEFGAEVLRGALEARGLEVRVRPRSLPSDVEIMVGEKGDPNLNMGGQDRIKVSEKAESYAISVTSDKRVVVIEGSDTTGVMYGEFELAEQVGGQPGSDFVPKLNPTSISPYLEVRGVNMFLTVQDIDESEGAFWSDEYWKTYLDLMARDRYNFLDIHGPCDAVTLTFPNGFSYFVSLPDFPSVGVGPERAARNLARFRQVIHMAADRGIKVGYMNYEAPPPIGPWKTRRFGVDERWPYVPQEFLKGPQLEQYTRQAVLSFLKQLPELWMFGFRIGESGQPEDFYKKTYLAALAELPSSLKIYLRTWIADPQKVRDLAASTRHPVYIEPKYNGEHLGLPYQAALGGRRYPPSGSFENYTDNPKNYSIIWQIRAHGTHRVFYWGSPEFARRTVRSCKLGDGVGFSMEPMEAYSPAADYLHHNPKTKHSFYKWMVEREWVWHLIWGRTAYDPDVPDQVFVNEFISHFGPQAGPLVFKALTESSKIVPFVYAYHNVGLDHQDFAPEFETGDHALGARSRLWQGTRLVPYGGNNDDFLSVDTLDRTAMAAPAIYAEDLLKGSSNGKMSPFEAANYLEAAAKTSEEQITEAASLDPRSAQNFECIRLDIEALAWLARYYRDRVLSATYLALYERTSHHPELTQASQYMHRAVADWDRLSEITEEHFGFVPEYIRMGVKDFRWRDEGRSLGVDLDQIDNLETAFRRLAQQGNDRVIIAHVPPPKVAPNQALKLTATFATAFESAHVYLFYRNSTETGHTKVELKREDEFERTWSGEIPADKVIPGFLEYYFEANNGRWGPYGGTIEQRAPYHVLVNDNNSKPILSHTPPLGPFRGDSVSLRVEVKAKAKLSTVYVYYKRLPAYYEWLRMEMQPAGQDHFTATVPLTPEGILYYFEAMDEDGNAVNYPDFLERTPYFAIDSWAPAAFR
jgi:hypothetical protein